MSANTAEPVSDDYPGSSPWPFTGGTILTAAVDVSGTPFVDLAEEAEWPSLATNPATPQLLIPIAGLHSTGSALGVAQVLVN